MTMGTYFNDFCTKYVRKLVWMESSALLFDIKYESLIFCLYIQYSVIGEMKINDIVAQCCSFPHGHVTYTLRFDTWHAEISMLSFQKYNCWSSKMMYLVNLINETLVMLSQSKLFVPANNEIPTSFTLICWKYSKYHIAIAVWQ